MVASLTFHDGANHTVNNGSISIHCRTDGADYRPWLVFSNSVATDLSLWDAQVRAFGDRYRILRYDHRGHGQTSAPSGPYTFPDLVGDAVAVMSAFDVADAVLIGVSIGAVTALQVAAHAPDRLKAVVACDGQWASPPTARSAWEARVDIARKEGMEPLVEPTVSRWMKPRADIASFAHVAEMIRTTPVDGYAGCAAALMSYDHREDARKIRLPTLLVSGAYDGQIPTVMQEMQANIPGSRYAEVPDAGHLPNAENPQAFNRILDAFLQEVSPCRG